MLEIREKITPTWQQEGWDGHWKLVTMVLGSEERIRFACLYFWCFSGFGQVGSPIKPGKEVEKLLRGSKKRILLGAGVTEQKGVLLPCM